VRTQRTKTSKTNNSNKGTKATTDIERSKGTQCVKRNEGIKNQRDWKN